MWDPFARERERVLGAAGPVCSWATALASVGERGPSGKGRGSGLGHRGERVGRVGGHRVRFREEKALALSGGLSGCKRARVLLLVLAARWGRGAEREGRALLVREKDW